MAHLSARVRRDVVIDVGIAAFAAVVVQSTPVKWLLGLVRMLLRTLPSARWRSGGVPAVVQVAHLLVFFALAKALRSAAARSGVRSSEGGAGDYLLVVRDWWDSLSLRALAS